LSEEKKGIRGRGTESNPGNRFQAIQYHLEEGETLTAGKTIFLRDHSKSVLSKNDSPDMGFGYGFNPYRGCEHGCVYCYARPYHEYLGFSAGLDFETKILVKEDAPELLRKEFASKKWEPQSVQVSGVTDAYQPIERKLGLTRKCIEVFAEFLNPLVIITKNALVTRDIDVLKGLAEVGAAQVCLSITTLDDEICGTMEPRTSRPAARLEAIRQLSEAGILVGVNVAPVIPGLTDHEIPSILEKAFKAGARSAWMAPVRLPHGVKDLFQEWLSSHYPDAKDKILHRITEVRGGKLNDPRFGTRLRGEGKYAEQLAQLFRITKRRLGYPTQSASLNVGAFRRPPQPGEQTEFSLI